MSKRQLNPEEQAILDAFESGTVQRIKDTDKQIKQHQNYAETTRRKDARINIRLSSRDLRGLQKRAIEEGLPYQTLAASILHEYLEGRLRENH